MWLPMKLAVNPTDSFFAYDPDAYRLLSWVYPRCRWRHARDLFMCPTNPRTDSSRTFSLNPFSSPSQPLVFFPIFGPSVLYHSFIFRWFSCPENEEEKWSPTCENSMFFIAAISGLFAFVGPVWVHPAHCTGYDSHAPMNLITGMPHFNLSVNGTNVQRYLGYERTRARPRHRGLRVVRLHCRGACDDWSCQWFLRI